jgi:hypothetical protein
MSRRARKIPSTIADFGEKQFKDLNPDLVEVLRVKASTIRKYWSQLRGITFLVAVVTSERVRIYFFNSQAVMLARINSGYTRTSLMR